MPENQSRNKRALSPPSLLIAAHCLTIQRKAKRLHIQELSAILDDCTRELNSKPLHSRTYLNSLNEIVHSLTTTTLPSLLSLTSHYFFVILRNTIRHFLHQLYTRYQVDQENIFVFRNCIILLQLIVKKITDVSIILHWITDITFLDTLADCLYQIKKISKADKDKCFIKQITRLLDLFINIQDRLPLDLHQSLFLRLLQPTIHCLTSSTYIQVLHDLNPNSNSLTSLQKLFLIKCPSFLTKYQGPQSEEPVEQVLEKMLPHYASLLNKHVKTIEQWHHPMMLAMYHLLTTIVFAKNSFTLRINNQLLQSLIRDLLRLLHASILIDNISENPQSLLINAALLLFSVLVYEPKGLEYIKRRKPASIFRRLTLTPVESIVWNAHMMLAYSVDEDDMKESKSDLSPLLYTTINLLHTVIETRNQVDSKDTINLENLDRNITQLIESLKGLIQYEQVKNEILKYNVIPFLIEYSERLNRSSKQFLLECLWTLSFNEQAANQLREYSEFILSLQNISKSADENNQQNTFTDELHKAANGILWNLLKGSQVRKVKKSDNQKYKYDIMISYCHKDEYMVYDIQQMLDNEGFNIWFDRDTHHEHPMETVAEAIDNSALVLICLSNSYKQDNQCQAESNYAYNCKRRILPVIVHERYKHDGWLTSIISKTKSINFGISDFETATSLLIKKMNHYLKKDLPDNNLINSESFSTEQIVRSSHSATFDQQQQEPYEQHISRSQTAPAYTSTLIDKQQKYAVRADFKSITPSATSDASPFSQTNKDEQIYLPEKYTKRDTSNSTYRSLSIDDWKKKDTLDFLYDLNLNIIMPLCESMSGQTLKQFFRMCQTKPSRLHKLLNEHLRRRFKNVTLPIGAYTQFLTEVENLLHSTTDTLPTSPPLLSYNNEHLVNMPDIVQPQVSTMQSPSSPATGLKSPVPNTTGRVVFRPASIASRPYDFIVDSAEDSTVLLEEIEHYSAQLLLLEQQARDQRKMKNLH